MNDTTLQLSLKLEESFYEMIQNTLIQLNLISENELTKSLSKDSVQYQTALKFRQISPESPELNDYTLIQLIPDPNILLFHIKRLLLIHIGIINFVGICLKKDKIFLCEEKYSETLQSYVNINQSKPIKYFLPKVLTLIEASLLLISKGFFDFFIYPENIVLAKGKYFAIKNIEEERFRIDYEAPEFVINQERTAESIVWSFGCLLFFIDTMHHPLLDISLENEKVKIWILTKGYKDMINNSSNPEIKMILQRVFKMNRNKRITLPQMYLEIEKYLKKG
jgi:serine/threonine protein kinase